MNLDYYKGIDSVSQGEFKEKGSKFLAFAHPVQSVDEVKSQLEIYKKDYFDARHICYAYIVGLEKEDTRSFDAGEPNGSAGLPILNQLRSFELKNVLLVVVRYFGGTKLGISGLTSAYKSAAKEVLSNCTIIEKPILEIVEIRFPYTRMNEMMKWLKEHYSMIHRQDFNDQECLIQVSILKSHKNDLFKVLSNSF